MHWRRPLDWNRGAGRRAQARPERVDVVIPVHAAAADLAKCLQSVVAHTDLSRHRLILALDGPQDASVEDVIRGFSSANVIRGDAHAGFAATANRGMAASATDVVLLNSDTIVTSGWLEKLIDAAYSHPDISTVTPLSNHATLCSVPQRDVENLLPSGYDVDTFAALVERVTAREYPRIPTAVGFCMYVRRALLDDIGAFDAATFGAGYGEENDFCMRALARGWLHVADDATFVFHAGSRSFRRSRAALQRRARGALARRHPRYYPTIAAFAKRDPVASVRARIVSALAPARPKRRSIVHVVHGWPPFQHAGTELYACWLVERQRETDRVAVYTRSADAFRDDGEAFEVLDRGVRVRLIANNFTSRNPLRRNAIRDMKLERDFERFLREQQPDLVHIHHLAGHTFSLASVARRLGVPVVMQIQDWWAMCPRVNLLDANGGRCSGPEPRKCAECVTLTRVAPGANLAIHVMRRSAAKRALRAASAFVAGSEAIRRDYSSIVPAATPFHVLAYGIAISSAPRQRRTEAPLRFGYVGSVAPHKGVHTAAEAIAGLAATLHVWGDETAMPEYVASMRSAGNVIFEGRFAECDKERVFDSFDVLLVPSIGLESFGLAAREAMARGIPVIASEGGALSELFDGGRCGELFPPGDVAALRAILERVVNHPAIVEQWSAAIAMPKTVDEHALEIERVYESVLR